MESKMKAENVVIEHYIKHTNVIKFPMLCSIKIKVVWDMLS